MKKKLKLCFTVALLAVAAFAFCFGAFNFGVNKASAADWTYGTKEEEKGTFAMVDSVKLRTDGDGFQFKAKMDKGTSESLSSNQKVYFILIPEIYKTTMGDLGACKAIARFTTGDNYGEYDIDNSLCLYVRAVRSELIDGYYYYYGGVSNLATVSQQKLNYYAVAVIETRNDDRTNGGKLTYNYTYATYETAAPETNIYSTITSAILNVEEDYMAEIFENYSWYGKEDYPLNVTSLEDYNKLVGKLNSNLDLTDIIIEFDADYASQDGAATITSEENMLHTVSFMNGDSVYKTYKVKNGAKITAPAVNPTKAPDNVYTYLFNSWQVSGKDFDFANETITTETVLNANYTSLTKEERASRYTTAMVINGNYSGAPTLFEPIAIAEFAGKAVHFEFKFVTETGKFGFAILDNPGWANITGTLTIEKKADGTIESNMGRVMELEDGWYAWELNSEFFGGDGAEKAENVGLIYNQGETVQGEVLIDWKSLAAVEPQTYFSSNNKIDWSFSSGNGIVSQIPSENGTHNALKITNDNTHSQAQWMYFVLQLDPATIAKLDNAKELALKLKLQRNTAASNVTFNFRISPAKLINDKWEPDNQNWAKNATDSGVDGYSDNVALDTWHTIRFLRNTCWGSDTIAALKANGGKILIFVELKNNNTSADFDSGTDFGFNLIIDDMTVTE